MDRTEFSRLRQSLAKTQIELARLLCVSPRAIQSFEQGWRAIPASAERQLLFLMAMRKAADTASAPCWEARGCPPEWREHCAAWEYRAGRFCWFINGTFCQGKPQENWKKKIILCRQCKVFQSI
jgi:transcriptional regulator with XRE-family HTH domain